MEWYIHRNSSTDVPEIVAVSFLTIASQQDYTPSLDSFTF